MVESSYAGKQSGWAVLFRKEWYNTGIDLLFLPGAALFQFINLVGQGQGQFRIFCRGGLKQDSFCSIIVMGL